MGAIFIQIFIIVMLIIAIKDIHKEHTYPKWCIFIYAFVLYREHLGFCNLLQLPEQYFLKFLCGITIFLLGYLGFMLIKFYRGII